jgi:hypothetical protein
MTVVMSYNPDRPAMSQTAPPSLVMSSPRPWCSSRSGRCLASPCRGNPPPSCGQGTRRAQHHRHNQKDGLVMRLRTEVVLVVLLYAGHHHQPAPTAHAYVPQPAGGADPLVGLVHIAALAALVGGIAVHQHLLAERHQVLVHDEVRALQPAGRGEGPASHARSRASVPHQSGMTRGQTPALTHQHAPQSPWFFTCSQPARPPGRQAAFRGLCVSSGEVDSRA